MEKILWISAGGAVGAVLRYLVSGVVQGMARNEGFPYGTLAVNLTGCLLIGLLSVVAETNGVFTGEIRAFIFIGVLGALTTFSTFSNDSMVLLRAGKTGGMLMNLLANTGLGLLMVWLGIWLGSLIGGR
jgi:fluoride exporter